MTTSEHFITLASHTSALAERDAEIATLKKALEASRDVHAGLAEYILKTKGRKDINGMFADLQRARLAADAALAKEPADA